VRRKIIGVIGAGADVEPQHLEFAYSIGRLLAENGAILICGGLGGIMETACHGACDAGGITVGVLPSENIATANQFVAIPVATGLGQARNKIIVSTAQALIAISGKYGTLSEIAFALDSGKRVYGLDTWDIEGIIKVETPEMAVRLALSEGPWSPEEP